LGMKKHIHVGSVGIIINFISVIGLFGLLFGTFASTAYAMAIAPHTCCSSVLFIPGLEGSRLYTQGFLSENQLWEPNRNADVEKLYLDANGKSLDQSVYTRDIIDSTNYPAFNIDIYQSFTDSMNSLVNNGTIRDWRPLAYDWRLDYNDIINNGIKTSPTATSSLIQLIKDMSSHSISGKVTIVAHSNGGLLAKALINELNRQGKSNLVDNLVLVAVPQLGTPESLPAILHGYGQDIFNGIFLNGATARTLAENMPTAYNLLPSEKYLGQNATSLITFDPSIDSISNLRKIYGDSISSSSALENFLLATADGRTKPDHSDLTIPNVLNPALLSNAKNVHQDLDNWIPPSNIVVSQVVGWGLDTVNGVKYEKKTTTDCAPICYQKDILDYRPLFDFHGDGVVMRSSADNLVAPTYYVNLAGVNMDQGTNRAHGDILETSAVQTLVKNILTKQMSLLPNNVTTSIASTTNSSLQVSVHSPVTLNLYDASGNHTGPINNPDQTSDLSFYETKIPNSYYLPFGEGVYAGINNPGTTTITLQGTGVGSFTLEINDQKFEDVPVLPTTTGSASYSSSGTSTLAVDLDGDGTTDLNIAPGQDFDPIAYLNTMKSVIASFGLTQKNENQLDKRIDNLITLIKKGKITKVSKKIGVFLKSNRLTKKHKKITADDQNIIINMLNDLLDNIK